MRALGLCIGASNISYVLLENKNNNINIISAESLPHEGNPRNTLKNFINDDSLKNIDYFAVTGRKLRHMLNAASISEPEALEYAYAFKNTEVGKNSFIVSAGGETFMVYQLDKTGKIINVYTGNKCASGTGEFFLQQLKRMDLSVEEAIEIADTNNPYKVAGRCSVFCKSDCTHALNKGAPKESIVAGLCEMMAGKILELLNRNECENVWLVGGTSENKVMVGFLKSKVPNIHIPEHSRCFEALGAALSALNCKSKPYFHNKKELFAFNESSFSFLPPLENYVSKVVFKEIASQKARPGDRCILGLDVGSTTTKAVLIRLSDQAVLASCYLRTNGDPINASRNCYSALDNQVDVDIDICGLGVTGSGRQIAGLHALTSAVINEIIAHAAAAVYFDGEVDTIFEIGGQDAKYTYINSGVPSDYAMNEACSAGTGSFLEEAAKESLDIDTKNIGDIALKSLRPPNFSDQCAAFISSDIKNAIQEGIEIEDITAGLVYSICMNYNNRVKGNRPVGKKVFMQGGVCYNKAVPVAMAALTGKEIIVPPEPGLMGAFGVALEVKNKLELGLIKPSGYSLKELAEREVFYEEAFICGGGAEKCDRKCKINRIEISGKVYPFGGACSKYYNILGDKQAQTASGLDLVRLREHLVFEKYGPAAAKRLLPPNRKKIGINNSLLVNTVYPLYCNFFTALGYDVVINSDIRKEGTDKKGAAFCYPVEIAHGSLAELIYMNPDIYFLPHIEAMPVENGIDASVVCPLAQAEPYYLKAAFEELKDKLVLSPVFDFSKGYEAERKTFINIGKSLGFDASISESAFQLALSAQRDFHKECQQIGRKFLDDLGKNPEEVAVVLLGRPYNAFAGIANMGIPKKFASKGYKIIPYDFLPFGKEEPIENMYWAMGQMILKASKLIKNHPQLFGTYITNFSCGPDSFLTSYFKNEMGKKPSLMLELDSHTADAGIDTRIEAFLDVIKSFIEISKNKNIAETNKFKAAFTFLRNGKLYISGSDGKTYPITSPKVHMLIPSMGEPGSRLLAATMRHVGIKSTSVPPPTEKELKIGRSFSSCKECLPLILTIGSLIDYLNNRKDKDEILLYFMPETSGPCRFGQYNVLMENIVEKMELKNVAMISLTSVNGYAGFGVKFALRAWQAIIISDVLDEIYSAVLVLSKNKDQALAVYNEVCNDITESIEKDSWKDIKTTLNRCVQKLKAIDCLKSPDDCAKIALIGEIYVRRDSFSRQYLVERLAQKNIMVKTAPVAEWMYYCDYLVKKRLLSGSNIKDRIKTYIQGFFKNPYERTIKEIFAKSGLYHPHIIDVDEVIKNISDLISPQLRGEAILTVGSALTEVVEDVSGVISIGPFGCMPCRIAEAVISDTINDQKLKVAKDKLLVQTVMEHYPSLPFLPIESDGNVFPQVIEARLEAFCLQVERLHRKVKEVKEGSVKHVV